jgi:hypothetical protein
MPENIDYKFLSDLEGGSKTSGYVPAAKVSKSGVTIATGFDLGQRNESDLNRLNLNTVLVKKLKPYLGLKAKAAQDYLKNNPLQITVAEAQSIDKSVKSLHIAQLKAKYNSAPGNMKKFSDIPAEAQTVVASVSFQYGVELSARTPKFWKAVTAQDWKDAVKILKSFGDAYPTRRKKEAEFLEKIK